MMLSVSPFLQVPKGVNDEPSNHVLPNFKTHLLSLLPIAAGLAPLILKPLIPKPLNPL